MKKIIISLIAVLLVFSLTACGSVSESSDNTTKADGDYPVTVDNYGREITVKQKPQKVLTLGPNCTELFAALGLADCIAGTSLKNHSRGPLPEYADIINNLPELNYGSATREAVISSGADFIYGIDWEFGDSALDLSELESCGITVYMNAASTLEEQYKEISDIGKIFGVEDKAQQFINEQKERISAVGAEVSSAQPVKVLVYDSGNDGVFTCGKNNFETLLLEKAGGKNIFDDITDSQWTTVSYEEVIARQPDVIVIHDYDSPSVEEKIAEIKSNAVLSQLDCVKNERFVVMELESVLPGSRTANTVERFAEGFYPEKFR